MIKGGGSVTTYYCDFGELYTSRIAEFGSSWANGSTAGAFCLYLYRGASYASSIIGAFFYSKDIFNTNILHLSFLNVKIIDHNENPNEGNILGFPH